jgi:hypothetical protein
LNESVRSNRPAVDEYLVGGEPTGAGGVHASDAGSESETRLALALKAGRLG